MTRSRQLLAMSGAFALTLPGLTLRAWGIRPQPGLAAVTFGLAVVGSAFLLAWTAEVLELDVSRGLAIAVLALIAVMPEYAVDFVFTWKAGTDPHQYAPLALANMTGGNRLLIGIGWPLVVLLAAWRMRRAARAQGYRGPIDSEVRLDRTHSVEIGFLAVATVYSLTLPLKHTLNFVDAAVLITLFVLYFVRITNAPAEEPELVGPAAMLGELSPTRRRICVGALLGFSATVVLLCAAPFADSLVETGRRFGVSTFLLVQWLAPIASEAPELLIAGVFAWRLNTNSGLGTLVSSKVNQWTLLVGSLPLVFAVASGTLHGLPLDTLQREELFLTAAQSAFAVAILANRAISVKEALALLTLFWSQFVLGAALPGSMRGAERVAVGVTYLVLAAGVLVRARPAVRPLLRDAFRTPITELASTDDRTPEPA